MVRRYISGLVAALFALSLAAITPATAAGNLPDTLVRAEVLPGWVTRDGTRMAALRLRLAPGWKTYWRAPGDAGIPPNFTWRGSRNVAGVTLHWPRPTVFLTSGMRTIGYEDELLLPLEIRPKRTNAPMYVMAEMELGICEEVCVPASLTFSAELSGSGASDPAIHTALASRPISAARAGVQSVTCRFVPISDGIQVTAQIRMPAANQTDAAVIEVRDPQIWVSEAKVDKGRGTLTVTADLVPPRGKSMSVGRDDLRFTILGRHQAVDIQGCRAAG